MTISDEIAAMSLVVQIEATMHEESYRMNTRSAEIIRLKGALDDGEHVREADVRALQMRLDAAKEGYLNALDRLCSCILMGIYDEEQAKLDYSEVMRTLPGSSLTFPDSPLPFNIARICERWNSGKGDGGSNA